MQRLDQEAKAGARIEGIRLGSDELELTFWSPFGARTYDIETTPNLK